MAAYPAYGVAAVNALVSDSWADLSRCAEGCGMGKDDVFEIAVIGAGPVGSVAAALFAEQGARVVLLEANGRAARRFAGEWLHPAGVRVLSALFSDPLAQLATQTGSGFVLFPNDSNGPISLPYPDGRALCSEHERLVSKLRARATQSSNVDFREETRVERIEGQILHVRDRRSDRPYQLRAARIIGADGRNSVVRQALGLADESEPLSYMLSLELKNASLPFEGMGHVALGGPGPILMYRLDENTIRGCVDIPLEMAQHRPSPEAIAAAYAAQVPEPLRESFREALRRGPLRWASNRFRARTCLGRDHLRLLGDAASHVHPLSAIGLTMGLLDAHALTQSFELSDYRKLRDGHVPELLANVLYAAFSRQDRAARHLRDALLEMLRAHPRERVRTMRILAVDDSSPQSFASTFLRSANGALSGALRGAIQSGELLRFPEALWEVREWLSWPMAALAPGPLRNRFRARSNARSPLALGFKRSDSVHSERNARTLQASDHASLSTLPTEPKPPALDTTTVKPYSDPLKGNSALDIDADWSYCREALVAVSRTFSEPIRMLPAELERALTLGYLQCRIADTIEDLSELDARTRDDLFTDFLKVLAGRTPPAQVSEAFLRIPGDTAELSLARKLDTVMGVFATLPEEMQKPCTQWVSEMVHGMRLYSQRQPGSDGIIVLYNPSDLNRYCYFVAGTVGHMITDLFSASILASDPQNQTWSANGLPRLRELGESFGVALQLVNILKDVTDDLDRGFCFVPESLCAEHGLSPRKLVEPAHRLRAHAAVAPMFDCAEQHLKHALEYSLLIPEAQTKLRLFCLLPLWMAARTLMLARGNDAMFTPGKRVKISRKEVTDSIAECVQLAGDDLQLKRRFGELWQPAPTALGQASAS